MLHQQDTYKTPIETVRCAQHQNSKWCLEHILGPALYKIAAVQPLASYLEKYPSNTNKTDCRNKNELIINVHQ